MQIEIKEEGLGDTREFVALINLPITTQCGQLSAFGHGTRKTFAEKDACLEACFKLDKLGILRSNSFESAKNRKKRLAEMYGEDEEDDFYDRTLSCKDFNIALD